MVHSNNGQTQDLLLQAFFYTEKYQHEAFGGPQFSEQPCCKINPI